MALRFRATSPVMVASMLVLAKRMAELASVLEMETAPLVAVALRVSVEMKPVAVTLLPASRRFLIFFLYILSV